MKRKKSVTPAPASIEQTVAEAPETKQTAMDTVWVCLFSGLLFVSMTIQTGRMSMLLAVLALALSIGRTPLRNLRQRFCVPVLGFIGFAFMQGFAAIYSHFGEYAVQEYSKFLAVFALAVLLLTRIETKHIRGILWGIAAVCAMISLLCVDAAVHGFIFGGFEQLAEVLGSSFSTVEQDILGNRISGIYNDANVSGSILALGSLVSLYLANDSQELWKRALACFLLGVSAMGLFLSMSRGALLCFAVALLVWLLAAGKGERLPLFFLMMFSAIVVVGLSIPAATALKGGSFLVDVLHLATGPVIFALDWAVGKRLASRLEGHKKLLLGAAAVLAVLCVGYAVAAVIVTGPYTFDESGYVDRAFELAPGTYTVSGDWDGNPYANILSQSKMDVLRRTGGGTSLYNGPLSEMSFTVTGEEFRLSIQIGGEAGQSLRELRFSDGTEVKLNYPLLPASLANRLQDSLLTSNSFLQRLEFFKDGWTLFLSSPIFGHGLGSTEGLLTSVQSYYYESKYVHSHLLQMMEETGLLGLAAYLTLLGGGAWLLLQRLRGEHDRLAALLLACLVMMNLHGLMEITFSVRAYQCLAYILLLLPGVLYGKPLSEKAAKLGGLLTAGLVWLYLAVFGGAYLSHRMVVKDLEKGLPASSASEFMAYTRSLVKRDIFDHEQMQLTYVGNAVILNDSSYNRDMRIYKEKLQASGTYTACSGLAQYYYLPKGQWEELFACSREGIAQEASNKDAWNLQFDFYRCEVLPAIGEENVSVFLDGVLGTKAYLEEYSQGRLEEIELTEENTAFLNTVASVRENGLPDAAAYLMLTQMFVPAETAEG